MENNFSQTCQFHFLEAKNPVEGKEWDIVCIETGESKNPTVYTENVLREAVPLFEGAKVYAYLYGHDADGKEKFDHLPDNAPKVGGFVRNLVGFLKEARYGEFKRPDGTTGKGILARLHILEGAKWLRETASDLWKEGKMSLLGFSIDAVGTAHDGIIGGRPVKIVDRIAEVKSTDVVSEPAAGGGFLRLVASCQGEHPMTVIELLRTHRPGWLDGFAAPSDKTDMKDYTYRILESNLVRAEDVRRNIPMDEVKKLAEISRGVKEIEHLIESVKGGKMEEAAKSLESWVAVNPAKDNATQYLFTFTEASMAEKSSTEVVPAPSSTEVQEALKECGKSLEEAKKGMDEGKAKLFHEKVQGHMALAEKKMAEGKHAEAMKHIGDAKAAIAAHAEPDGDEGEDGEVEPNEEEKKMSEALVAKENALKVKESELLVKEKLLASGLTALGQARVAKLFNAKESVKSEEVDAAITEEKAYVASFKEGKVEGLGAAHSNPEPKIELGKSQDDKWRERFDSFFEGGMASLKEGVAPITSLRRAYGEYTGRWNDAETMSDELFSAIALAFPSNLRSRSAVDMANHSQRVRESWRTIAPVSLRESITTTGFTVTFGDAMYRRLQKEYISDPLSDWRKIVSGIENLADATNKFHVTRIGEKGKLPAVAQQGPYQENVLEPTELDTYMTPTKYGDLFKLTWEDVLADRVNVLRRLPRIIARSVNRTIHLLVWANLESNPTMSDGNALISADHSNVINSSGAIGYINFEIGVGQLANQTEQDSGYKLGLTPKYLITSKYYAPMTTAIEICKSEYKVLDGSITNAAGQNATVTNVNKYFGVEPLATVGLGLTTATRSCWYVMADPSQCEGVVVGFLGGRDQADIFVQGVDTPTQGSMFDSDAITFKTRLVFSTAVGDWRGVQGSLISA